MKKILPFVAFIVICQLPHKTFAQEKKGLKNLLGVNVEKTEDKFEGTTTYTMTGNKVKIDGAVGSSVAKGALGLISGYGQLSILTTRLQLENHINKSKESQLAVILKISIQDDSRFYPMAGESLIFLVDDERIGLSTEGKYNSEYNGYDSSSKVFARYPITKEQLEKIINAQKVEFRLIQSHFMDGAAETRDKAAEGATMEGEFSKKNFKAWKDFYENYILKTP